MFPFPRHQYPPPPAPSVQTAAMSPAELKRWTDERKPVHCRLTVPPVRPASGPISGYDCALSYHRYLLAAVLSYSPVLLGNSDSWSRNEDDGSAELCDQTARWATDTLKDAPRKWAQLVRVVAPAGFPTGPRALPAGSQSGPKALYT